MRRLWTIVALLMLMLLAPGLPVPALAQTGQPAGTTPDLLLFTSYPSQTIGINENVSLPLKLRAVSQPQIVQLEMKDLPEGWTATFQGGGKIIQSAYVNPDADTSVTLKLEPPSGMTSNVYRFVVLARGDGVRAELPIELTVKDRLPPRLSFTTDLPTKRGGRSTTFSFSTTLKNEGDEDLTVNLNAEPPDGFTVKFKLSGQEVTSLPLEANKSKSISVEAKAYADVSAGTYPFKAYAQSEDANASLSFTAEVTGQPDLKVTAPGGLLSGKAEAGNQTTLSIIVQNNGSAPAHAVKLSATQPSGWSVEFDPKQIDQIMPGKQVEATAKVRPADKAVAGDYMITIKARPEETVSEEKVDFRITVTTSTLWGVVGIALIAVAVGVVALAVLRFGRR